VLSSFSIALSKNKYLCEGMSDQLDTDLISLAVKERKDARRHFTLLGCLLDGSR